MAPEFPPSVVIFDAHMENDRLQGQTEYIEPKKKGDRLRWYWNIENPPDAGQPVGDGVAFVGPEFSSISGLHRGPDYEGEQHYTWSEGLNAGIPWVLFALVLPTGYTLSKMNPSPVGTKLFRSRIALYWVLRGDDQFGRTQVSWILSPLQSSPNQELVRLNRLRSNLPSMGADSLTIEDGRTLQSSSNSVAERNPWKSGSFYLVAAVVIIASLIVAYRSVGLWALPLVLICALLLVTIIGAMQLRNDEALKDETFLDLMRETLKRFPLLRRGNRTN